MKVSLLIFCTFTCIMVDVKLICIHMYDIYIIICVIALMEHTWTTPHGSFLVSPFPSYCPNFPHSFAVLYFFSLFCPWTVCEWLCGRCDFFFLLFLQYYIDCLIIFFNLLSCPALLEIHYYSCMQHRYRSSLTVILFSNGLHQV